MSKGLFGKYIIAKADGSPVDPNADYFVLRLDTDARARHAARVYARDVYSENRKLSEDIERRCDAYGIAAIDRSIAAEQAALEEP